jgi:hypothetical protein
MEKITLYTPALNVGYKILLPTLVLTVFAGLPLMRLIIQETRKPRRF